LTRYPKRNFLDSDYLEHYKNEYARIVKLEEQVRYGAKIVDYDPCPDRNFRWNTNAERAQLASYAQRGKYYTLKHEAEEFRLQLRLLSQDRKIDALERSTFLNRGFSFLSSKTKGYIENPGLQPSQSLYRRKVLSSPIEIRGLKNSLEMTYVSRAIKKFLCGHKHLITEEERKFWPEQNEPEMVGLMSNTEKSFQAWVQVWKDSRDYHRSKFNSYYYPDFFGGNNTFPPPCRSDLKAKFDMVVDGIKIRNLFSGPRYRNNLGLRHVRG